MSDSDPASAAPAVVDFLAQGVAIYAVLGCVFAVAFALRGARAVDPVAQHATAGFRLLVLPGAALLWPLLARRWWLATTGRRVVPGERTDAWGPGSERLRAHALVAWLVIGPLAAATLVAALVGALESHAASAARNGDAARLPPGGPARGPEQGSAHDSEHEPARDASVGSVLGSTRDPASASVRDTEASR